MVNFGSVQSLEEYLTQPSARLEAELARPRTLDMKTHEQFGDYTRRIYRLLGME